MLEAINLKFIAARLSGKLIQIPARQNSQPEGTGLLQVSVVARTFRRSAGSR